MSSSLPSGNSAHASSLGDVNAVRMRLREAIDDNPKRLRYVVVAIGLIAASVWFYGQSRSAEPAALTDLPRASATPTTSAGSEDLPTVASTAGPDTAAEGAVVVQVVGAVVTPGVYEMSDGDRVNDAVAKAGGMAGDADIARVNLAAKLVDGQQVFVAKVGEAALAAAASTGASGGGAAAGPPSIVNINSASVEELDSLPGIGPSLAAAIVSHRDKNGPFKAVAELNDVKGIGDSKFADLEDKVTV